MSYFVVVFSLHRDSEEMRPAEDHPREVQDNKEGGGPVCVGVPAVLRHGDRKQQIDRAVAQPSAGEIPGCLRFSWLLFVNQTDEPSSRYRCHLKKMNENRAGEEYILVTF